MRAAESPARALDLADKLLYAVGSLGNAALFWALPAWLIYFYAPPPESGRTPLMPVAAIAIAFAIGKAIEAFDDPLIGWWSDRTRSRWGRRIPFLLFGTPVLALFFWLIWMPPVPEESLINAIYFFVVVEVFFFANTIVQAPYEALQAEIASTSTDRVSLGAWKVLFGAFGLVFALVISPLLIERIGFSGMGLTLALVATASLYLCLFGLWRRGTLSSTTAAPEDAPSLWQSVRATLAHGPFRALAASYLFFTAGYMLLPSFLPYYVRVAFGASEERVTIYTAGVIALVLLSLPLLSIAVRRWGKRAVYAGSMLALGVYLPIAGMALFRTLGTGLSLEAQSVAFTWLSGLGFAALFVLPGALMADVIDDDARQTGAPRAAIYYGMMQTLQKMAQAVAAGTFGLLLQLFGYSADQPLGIQLVLPVAGVLAFVAFVCVWRGYHLGEAPTAATQPPRAGARILPAK